MKFFPGLGLQLANFCYTPIIGLNLNIKRAMLDAWQDCLVPVGEFHGYLDVLISKGRLLVLSLDYSISKIALECARDYRLLPMDALHTACCKAFGIKEMATNDGDFERVSFLNLWIP